VPHVGFQPSPAEGLGASESPTRVVRSYVKPCAAAQLARSPQESWLMYTTPTMVLSLAICVTAVVLEIGAVVLLLRRSLWREYPFFFLYAIWLLVGNSAILVVDLWYPTVYATAFWYSDSSDIVLRLLVVWEVFRQTFPKNSGLSRSFSKGLGIVAVGLLVVACLAFWGYLSYGLPSLAYPEQVRVASWRPH